MTEFDYDFARWVRANRIVEGYEEQVAGLEYDRKMALRRLNAVEAQLAEAKRKVDEWKSAVKELEEQRKGSDVD
ncbi:hypothetical protein WD019_02360 [Fictibacillus sp. Mic-4]|uniref:hypothetical protein n=1 Tax=Fictibacillus sp. Mic-4 TaxID=3132826 RepID=UPI003CF4CB45